MGRGPERSGAGPAGTCAVGGTRFVPVMARRQILADLEAALICIAPRMAISLAAV